MIINERHIMAADSMRKFEKRASFLKDALLYRGIIRPILEKAINPFLRQPRSHPSRG